MTDHYLFDAEVSLRKYVCDTKFCDILECLVTGVVANMPPEPWEYLSDRLSELKSRKGAYSWNMFVEDDGTLQKRIFPKGNLTSIPIYRYWNHGSVRFQNIHGSLTSEPSLRGDNIFYPLGVFRLIEKEEKALEPTADMYMTAHTHYQTKLLTNSMFAFREWRERQLLKRTAEQSRFKVARAVFNQKLCVRVCVANCVTVSWLNVPLF